MSKKILILLTFFLINPSVAEEIEHYSSAEALKKIIHSLRQLEWRIFFIFQE